jgi:56kDa selenium binding protein (SBP56)
VPPLISDIDLSVDDRWRYVACWGTGELKQYDVSDPFAPRETASARLGGIVRRQPHPAVPNMALSGGPQVVEISRDGKRVYLTNSLYASWDDIFYPSGVGARPVPGPAQPASSAHPSVPPCSTPSPSLRRPATWPPTSRQAGHGHGPRVHRRHAVGCDHHGRCRSAHCHLRQRQDAIAIALSAERVHTQSEKTAHT